MKTSKKGIEEIVRREGGIYLKAYQDAGGVWTIGAGSTMIDGKKVYKGQVITKQTAINALKNYIASLENYVNQRLKKSITQNQFDALISIGYTTGAAGLNNLLQIVNTRPIFDSIKAITTYRATVKGQPNTGLKNRRLSEAKQFATKKENTNEIIFLFAGAGLILYLVSK